MTKSARMSIFRSGPRWLPHATLFCLIVAIALLIGFGLLPYLVPYYYLHKLGSPDKAQRELAIRVVTALALKNPELIEQIQQHLETDNDDAFLAAARVLHDLDAFHYPGRPPEIPLRYQCLMSRSTHPAIRAEALELLGRLPPLPDWANRREKQLLEGLEDEEPVALAAVRGAGFWLANPARNVLQPALDNPSTKVRALAWQTLRLRNFRAATDAYRKGFNDKDPLVRKEAMLAAAHHAPQLLAVALPKLLEGDSTGWAAYAAGFSDPQTVGPLLLTRLKKEKKTVIAARLTLSLGRLRYAPAFSTILENAKNNIAADAGVWALGAIDPDRADAAFPEILTQAIQARRARTVGLILYAWRKPPQNAFPPLRRILTGKANVLRSRAAELLATSGEFHPLEEMLTDPSPVARDNAAIALARLAPDRATTMIRKLLALTTHGLPSVGSPSPSPAPNLFFMDDAKSAGAWLAGCLGQDKKKRYRKAIARRLDTEDNWIVRGYYQLALMMLGDSSLVPDAIALASRREFSRLACIRALLIAGRSEGLDLLFSPTVTSEKELDLLLGEGRLAPELRQFVSAHFPQLSLPPYDWSADLPLRNYQCRTLQRWYDVHRPKMK